MFKTTKSRCVKDRIQQIVAAVLRLKEKQTSLDFSEHLWNILYSLIDVFTVFNLKIHSHKSQKCSLGYS